MRSMKELDSREKRLLGIKEGHLDSHGDTCKGKDPDCDTCFLIEYFEEEVVYYQDEMFEAHENKCWSREKYIIPDGTPNPQGRVLCSPYLFDRACHECTGIFKRWGSKGIFKRWFPEDATKSG